MSSQGYIVTLADIHGQCTISNVQAFVARMTQRVVIDARYI